MYVYIYIYISISIYIYMYRICLAARPHFSPSRLTAFKKDTGTVINVYRYISIYIYISIYLYIWGVHACGSAYCSCEAASLA